MKYWPHQIYMRLKDLETIRKMEVLSPFTASYKYHPLVRGIFQKNKYSWTGKYATEYDKSVNTSVERGWFVFLPVLADARRSQCVMCGCLLWVFSIFCFTVTAVSSWISPVTIIRNLRINSNQLTSTIPYPPCRTLFSDFFINTDQQTLSIYIPV